MFFSVNVDMIFGEFHSMVPDVQWRACLEMPEMFSSVLVEVASAACWLMRVRKETRVCPMYLASGVQSHDNWYTPFLSRGSRLDLFAAQKRFPSLGPGLVWMSTSFCRKALFSCLLILGTNGMDAYAFLRWRDVAWLGVAW